MWRLEDTQVDCCIQWLLIPIGKLMDNQSIYLLSPVSMLKLLFWPVTSGELPVDALLDREPSETGRDGDYFISTVHAPSAFLTVVPFKHVLITFCWGFILMSGAFTSLNVYLNSCPCSV